MAAVALVVVSSCIFAAMSWISFEPSCVYCPATRKAAFNFVTASSPSANADTRVSTATMTAPLASPRMVACRRSSTPVSSLSPWRRRSNLLEASSFSCTRSSMILATDQTPHDEPNSNAYGTLCHILPRPPIAIEDALIGAGENAGRTDLLEQLGEDLHDGRDEQPARQLRQPRRPRIPEHQSNRSGKARRPSSRDVLWMPL